jgi:hypothetical protein
MPRLPTATSAEKSLWLGMEAECRMETHTGDVAGAQPPSNASNPSRISNPNNITVAALFGIG